jgi:hypothetical protein
VVAGDDERAGADRDDAEGEHQRVRDRHRSGFVNLAVLSAFT